MLESDLSPLESVMSKAPRGAFEEYLALKAQRDALLTALETISGAAWALPDPELNRITIDAIKAEADQAIAAAKALDAATKEE